MTDGENLDRRRRPVRGAQARPRPQVQDRGGRAATAGALLRRAGRSPAGRAHAGAARRVPGLATAPPAAQLQPSVGCGPLPTRMGGQPATAGGLATARPPHAGRPPSRIPFIFDPVQARRLLDAAAALPDNPRARQRGSTYRTIFALCYGLGLRAGEACGLRVGDVDRDRGLLVVRGGKFGKSRLVPHGPRIGELRRRAARAAIRWRPAARRPAAVHLRWPPSVDPCTASQTFHRLVGDLGLRAPAGVSPPTLHSLRHSFAVGCLLRWYRQGVDPAARLHQLSTFMGHVDPSSTAVYLTITPALLHEANCRFEAFAEPAWAGTAR